MKIESIFDIGDTCWCTNGSGAISKLTIGLVRVEIVNSPGIKGALFDNYKAQKGFKEEYMCIETGIGTGSVYTFGQNIFLTEDEAIKAMDSFSVDDKGNEATFYEKLEDGTWEPGAKLYREAGENANSLCWDNWSGDELEKWACANGYSDEIEEGKL